MGMNYACVLLELARKVPVDEKALNICLAELRRAGKTGQICNICKFSFKYLIYLLILRLSLKLFTHFSLIHSRQMLGNYLPKVHKNFLSQVIS